MSIHAYPCDIAAGACATYAAFNAWGPLTMASGCPSSCSEQESHSEAMSLGSSCTGTAHALRCTYSPLPCTILTRHTWVLSQQGPLGSVKYACE